MRAAARPGVRHNAAAAVFFLDDFNRSDRALSDNGWSAVTNIAPSVLDLVGNKVVSLSGGKASKRTAPAGALDVSIDVTTPSGGSSVNSFSIYIGSPTFSPAIFIANVYPDGHVSRHYYPVSADTSIGTGYLNGTYRLRVTIDAAGMGSGGGGTAKVYVDGVLLDTLTGINLGGNSTVSIYCDTTALSADNFNIV